MKFWISGR